MKKIKVLKKGRIAIITINNPSKLNAMDSNLMAGLAKTVSDLDKNENISVIILTGVGKSFISGGDIREMSTFNPKKAFDFALHGKSIVNAILNSRKAIMAAVNGYALGGGCEVTLACDIIVASDKAIFGQPEV